MKKLLLLVISMTFLLSCAYASNNTVNTTHFILNAKNRCPGPDVEDDYKFGACLVNSIDTTEWNGTVISFKPTEMPEWLFMIEGGLLSDDRKQTKGDYKNVAMGYSDSLTFTHFFSMAIELMKTKKGNNSESFIAEEFPTWLINSVESCKFAYVNLQNSSSYRGNQDRAYSACLARHTMTNKDEYKFAKASLPRSVVQFLGLYYSPEDYVPPNNPSLKSHFYEKMIRWTAFGNYGE